jgi:NADPH:quinone reductase
MMKAVRIHQYGDVDVLKVEELDKPDIQAHEVLVKVDAVGINPVDCKVRKGMLKEVFEHHFPLTLGWDVAGRVAAVGSNVTKFKAGDEVFGLLNFPGTANGYAEYVSARAVQLAFTPAKFTMAQAAAFPLAALTAWQTLFEVGKLKANQTVLIHAAAGGVGHIAVQLAKWKGAKVAVTASKGNHAFLAKLGADLLIDYQSESFKDKLKDVDLILDGVGGQVTADSLDVIKAGGMLISLPQPVSEELKAKADAKSVSTPWHIVHPSSAQLSDMVNLADDGLLSVEVAQSFPLERVSEAHALVETGHVIGKVVIKIS